MGNAMQPQVLWIRSMVTGREALLTKMNRPRAKLTRRGAMRHRNQTAMANDAMTGAIRESAQTYVVPLKWVFCPLSAGVPAIGETAGRF